MFDHDSIFKDKAKIVKTLAYHYPDFVVGACVGVRYRLDTDKRYGRIQSLMVKYPDNYGRNHVVSPYGVFLVRMEDGSLREEHPEHLIKATAPKPTLSMSETGRVAFDVATMMMGAA